MDMDLLQKRDRMIRQMQVLMNEADFAAASAAAHDPTALYATLQELTDQYGGDHDTQGHIMLALDGLLDYQSYQDVRRVTVQLLQCATERKGQTAGCAETHDYEAFEQKLAAYWRLLLLSDNQMPRAQQVREVESVCAHTTSFPLRQQADAVRGVLIGSCRYSPCPPVW